MMNFRNFFYLLFVLPFLAACNGGNIGGVSENVFSLRAEFVSCPADSLRLYKIEGYQMKPLFSAPLVAENGKATALMAGTLPARGFYAVGTAPNNVQTILLGGEKGVLLTGNCSNIRSLTKVENSPLNDTYSMLNKTMTALFQQSNGAAQKFNMAINTGQGDMEAIRREIDGVYNRQLAILDSLKKTSPLFANLFGMSIYKPFDGANNPEGFANSAVHYGTKFMEHADLNDPSFDYLPVLADNTYNFASSIYSSGMPPQEAEVYMDKLLARAPAGSIAYKNILTGLIRAFDRLGSPSFIKYGQMYAAQFPAETSVVAQIQNRMANLQAEVARMQVVAEGSVPPEINMPTPQGRNLKLSDLRGKVVLVDFWASWCRPCRMESPNLVKAYNKYKNKGFDIYSVSLDRPDAKDKWIKAIQDDGLVWNHVSDLKFWQCEAAKAYGVSSIPATFLLDRDGRIIAKNLRGQALDAKLAEIFGGES
jgi:peroxiredoxin